jgi:hypothetical protein
MDAVKEKSMKRILSTTVGAALVAFGWVPGAAFTTPITETIAV